MVKDLWLNLPVKDLARAVGFYERVGFARDSGPGNTASPAYFLVAGNRVVLMLFEQQVFVGFTGTKILDAHLGSEVLISLGASSKAEVDRLAELALAGGGTVYAKPAAAGEMMYGCGFSDPDGHRWNVLFMAEV